MVQADRFERIGDAGLFIGALTLGLRFSAHAADHRVHIENQTGETLTEFYASVTSTNEREEDILGTDMIEDGETFDIDDGSGECRYDFRAVFEGGDVLVEKNNDVCKVSTSTYSR